MPDSGSPKGGLFKFFSYLVTGIAALFALAQLIVARNVGSFEAYSQMINTVYSENTSEAGLRWAMEELSACQPWTFDLRPSTKNASAPQDDSGGSSATLSSWEAFFGGRWEYCRSLGRDLSGISVAKEFSYPDFMYCPAANKKNVLALLGWPEYWPTGAKISTGNFSCVSFDYAQLPALEVHSSKLIAARFLSSDLRRSVWRDVDLRFSEFDKADLEGAIFSGKGVRLSGSSFERAKLRGARFEEEVDLSNVSFLNADLSGADLTGARGLSRLALRRACADNTAPPKLPADMQDIALSPC